MKEFLSHLKSGPDKFRNLTIAILLWFMLFPFLENISFGLIFTNILTSAIVLFGINAVSRSNKTISVGLTLGLPWFILTWIDILIKRLPLTVMIISNLFLILFLSFTAVTILLSILRSAKIDGDNIYGAICIYFLIGGTWSTIYMLLEAVQPGSIINTINGDVGISDLLYFSFITLTTLGYGDIIPVTAGARLIAMIEAIAGVMYIAIIISRLVGMFVSSSLKKLHL